MVSRLLDPVLWVRERRHLGDWPGRDDPKELDGSADTMVGFGGRHHCHGRRAVRTANCAGGTAVRRSGTSQGDVLVYSGHAWEKLVPFLDPFGGLIDVLISDPFDASAGQSRPLRGSDNQRMHLLSDVGRERYGALLNSELNDRTRVLDLFIDEKGDAWFAGIPRLGDMRRLKELLAEDGIEASITQAADDR
jgi:hypothetical protein